MNLSELLKIMDNFFIDKVESGSVSGKKTIGDKVKVYLFAFINPIDEDKNPILDLKDDYLRKIFNGSEKLSPDNASFLNANLELKNWQNFCLDLTDDAVEAIISLFAKHHKYINFNTFENDIFDVFKEILYYIVNVKPSASIRKSKFISPSKIKIGNNILELIPELIPTEDILEIEQPYVNALLRVYSQDSKIEDITLDKLKTMTPKYTNHFKVQREHYFSAESVLHQTRDIFNDAEAEFTNAKNETFAGISPVIFKSYKNAFARLNSTMEHVVLITYGKSYLTNPSAGFLGSAEKQGIVHMLVNDGKIEWVVDDDEDI